MTTLLSLLVDLSLFGTDEGPFVDVGMNLDVRVIGQFQGIPLAVIENHR